MDAAVPPGEVDFAEALGLRAPLACGTKAPRRRRKKPAEVSARPLDAAVVQFERLGFEPWRPRLLLGEARTAVHMEASAENFAALRLLVTADLEAEPVAAGERKRKGTPAVRCPRGPRGKREYWRSDRSRWLVKMPLGGEVAEDVGGDTAGPKGCLKFRTLTRRPSDEIQPDKKRSRGRSAASAVAGDGFASDFFGRLLSTLSSRVL